MFNKVENTIAQQLKQSVFQNRAASAIVVCIAFLLLYALVLGWNNYTVQNENSTKYHDKSREDWLQNPDKNPHRMAHYGNYAFRESGTLSIFEPGLSSFFGTIIYLEAHKQNSANFSEATASSSILRFGSISVAFIIQMLLPLLIFFIGYNTIASERENGTLKLILSQGVSWKQLLAGKIFGLFRLVMLVYVPLVLLLFAVWFLDQFFQFSADSVLKLFAFVLIHFFYLLSFCVITVVISAFSTTSKKALIGLIGLWLLLFVILPRGTQALGSYLYPAPSKIKFNTQIENDILKIGDSHNPDDPHFKAIKDSVLLAHKVDSVQKLPFNFAGFLMTKGEKISSSIYNKHLEKLLEIHKKQNRFLEIVSFINPYIAIKNLSMGLSGTDYNSYIDFQKQAEDYRYAMAQKMNGLQIKFISNDKSKPAKIDKKHWSDLQEFHYEVKGFFAVLKNEIIAVIALLVWIGVLFISIKIASNRPKAI